MSSFNPADKNFFPSLSQEFSEKARQLTKADLQNSSKNIYNPKNMNALNNLSECLGKSMTWASLLVAGSLFSVPPVFLCGAAFLGLYQAVYTPLEKQIKNKNLA